MRIAYVCADPGVPVFGQKGCSVHVQEVIRALRRQGAGVELFANRLGGAPPTDLADLHVRQLPPLPAGDLAQRERAAQRANYDLAAALVEAGPFDLVYERYSLWSYAALAYARATAIPGLLEVNAPLIDEQAAWRGLLDRPGAELVARRAFAAATALLPVSTGVAGWLRTWTLDNGRIHVTPNGVDAARFSAQRALSRPDARFTVGFVGTLKPWHGVPTLVEAFARFHTERPHSRLLIVGDGPLRTELEQQARAAGLAQALELTGAVAPDEVPSLLASMDIATAPYPALEACYFSPLKLFEYMAAGLPIVCSRIGQVEEVIAHEATGLLCAPGDAFELAGALTRLYDEPDLRRRLGTAARVRAVAEHSWDSVARRILELAVRPRRTALAA